ncbi:hypothetical protein [Paenisporosarcina antarctica]|uniref:hypothetical protein n=1 Tax=Paenisporosarcina antarctica TaxID=417367 RepID=UPI001416FEA5|nr:hypothetical protein [Paenisporosarcina antarctica]
MSLGKRLLIGFPLMGILFTIIISFIEPGVRQSALIGFCVFLVLIIVNYKGYKKAN